jgi:hypothetical protein
LNEKHVAILFFIFITFYFSLSKSVANEESTFEQTISNYTSDNYDVLLFIFFIIIIVGAIVWQLTLRRTKERRYFSIEVKRQVLKDQNYKCVKCKRNTGVWDYDHKNGDRSNNKKSNCQALCPNCHAKKTRGLLKVKKKSNLKPPIPFIFFVIVFFLIFIYFSNA